MGKHWLILGLVLILGALIISGCETTDEGATSTPVSVDVEATPTPTQPAPPTDVPTVTPTEVAVDVLGPAGARDAALAYIGENHAVQVSAPDLPWTEENVTPEGLVGSSRFQYTADDWVIIVSFPIVAPQATIYQVVVYNPVTGFQWEGEVDAGRQVTEQAVNLGAGVGYEGISFSYSNAIAAEVVAETVPAVDSPAEWEVEPEHFRFSFNGYVLPETFHEPRIVVYPVSKFEARSEIAGNIIAALREFLAERPAAQESIPFLPMWNAGQMMQSQVAYIDFQNGAGVRFLTQYGQAALPVNNHDMFYTFQGLTDDGHYYVAAILPASHPSLPADGTEVPGGDWAAFADNYQSYVTDIEQQLDAQDVSSFVPDLSLLDVMIQSLEVTPALTSGETQPEEVTQAPEIISLDETWNQYTNYRLGFSIKFPETMAAFNGVCAWNEEQGSYRHEMALVPVRIFEDADAVYIAGEYYFELAGERTETTADGGSRYFFEECNQVANSLELLRDPENFNQQMRKLVAVDIHDDAELDGFIKARYGPGCSLGETVASSQEEVYDVRIQGDGKDLAETQCPLNYGTVVKYYPEGNRVIAWDTGQAYTFPADVNYSVTNDQEMVESFKFLTGQDGPYPGWAGYANADYGFALR